jgi:hypothetical protein
MSASSATTTSSRNTSLKWWAPDMSWIGVMVTPALRNGTMNSDRPSWRSEPGVLRASR